ncbi:MAG: hypothetical protein RSG77_17005 [Hafnia sp.]
MGGRALKEHGVSRLDHNTYVRLSSKVMDALAAALADLGATDAAQLVPSLREKTSHGDIDVVVPEASFVGKPHTLIKALAKQLGVETIEYKQGGNILNCVLHDGEQAYQVDLICVKQESLAFAVSYLSWNDVSTILLRVVSRMGLCIGINGLSLTISQGTNKLGRVMLTRDYKEALTHLGLDAERWSQGFNNLEEVYEFFAQWHGFHPNIFALEKMSPMDVKSVMKRPGYLAFVEWIANHPEKLKRFDWHAYKQTARENLWLKFPVAKADYDALFADIQRGKDCQAKFNGHQIGEITGYTGKQLGDFIIDFKKRFKDQREFQEYVLATEQDMINSDIAAHLRHTQHQ